MDEKKEKGNRKRISSNTTNNAPNDTIMHLKKTSPQRLLQGDDCHQEEIMTEILKQEWNHLGDIVPSTATDFSNKMYYETPRVT